MSDSRQRLKQRVIKQIEDNPQLKLLKMYSGKALGINIVLHQAHIDNMKQTIKDNPALYDGMTYEELAELYQIKEI